ncbi:MAG: hypothetical protein ABJN22_02180 [Litorimonas sp.]
MTDAIPVTWFTPCPLGFKPSWAAYGLKDPAFSFSFQASLEKQRVSGPNSEQAEGLSSKIKTQRPRQGSSPHDQDHKASLVHKSPARSFAKGDALIPNML